MKNCTKMLFAAVYLLCAISSQGQKPSTQKPSLFHNYPASIGCTETELANLFLASKGEWVNISLPGNLTLKGKVTSKINKYSNLQTINIQLPEFQDILFSVTKRYEAGNKAIYIGHLFNTNYSDGYELKRAPNNTYRFIKIETAQLLPTCDQ